MNDGRNVNVTQQPQEAETSQDPPAVVATTEQAEDLTTRQQETSVDFSKSTPVNQGLAVSTPTSTKGIHLRSGTVLSRTPAVTKVSLENYLSTLLNKARESDVLSVAQCDALDKRIVQSREQRLDKIQNFKNETERFRKELLEFEGFSRSLSLASKGEELQVSPETPLKGETSASEVVLNWLGDSLLESSPESFSEPPFRFSGRPAKMVDYGKVAKLTAQMVPLFTGEPTPTIARDLQTFLGCCRQVKQCLTEGEQEAFLHILPTRLRGEAYQLLASITPTTYRDVEDLLNRTYLPRETYQELVNKLITMRQVPLEALTAFTARIKKQLRDCHEAAETKYNAAAVAPVKTQLEDFAKNALKSGVCNPHLCQYLLTLGEDPLDTLIQKALDMERLQQTALNLHPLASYGANTMPSAQYNAYPYAQTQITPPSTTYPNFQPTAAGTSPPGPPQYQSSQSYAPNNPVAATNSTNNTGLDYRRQNQSPTHRGKPFANITCNFCQIRGHTYTDCLKRKNTPYCTRCRQYNHDVRDCRRPAGPPQQRPPENQRPNNNYRPQQDNRRPYQGNNSRPQQPPGQNNRGVFHFKASCEFCGRRGHSDKECAHKRKWEAKKQGNDSQSTQNSPARL